MNASELLEQFILESREGLEQIGHRLLEVERAPGDRDLLNELFRLVHTLKGNCGLFDFEPLERLVHAAEDVLDRVRGGGMAYDGAIADDVLAAMDLALELVEAIASSGALPDAAAERSERLATALRTHLSTPAPGVRPAIATDPGGAAVPSDVPDWARRVPDTLRRPGVVAIRYRPEPDCFFKGEDPWRLALTVPGLLHLEVGSTEPWPAPDRFDCYRCTLELTLAADASADAIGAHFRYVPEQLEQHAFAVGPVAAADGTDSGAAVVDPIDAALAGRIATLWDAQRATLAHPGAMPGVIEAARTVLGRLAAAADPGAAGRALPADGAALLAWADAHHPDGPRTGSAPAARAASVGPEPRRGGGGGGGGSGSGDDAQVAQKVLRVSQDKVDRLMDLIGEMVVAKNALPYLAQRAETVYRQRDLAREIKAQYAVVNRIAEDMQRAIMQVRMLPVGTVFQRFGRLVRDLSRRLGKDVRLVVEGEDTEADKTVVESLSDPLIHIVRNSLDHGLETPEARAAAGKPPQGTLHVSARQEADRVVIEIADDGTGIDTARVRAKAVERGLVDAARAAALTDHEAAQLVFLPGFSTADTISDLSGRGVGMDVVRTAIERVNGTVELTSERGRGTRIRLSLPLSMAVSNVMTIELDGHRFGIPMDAVVETVRIPAEDVHTFKRARTAVLRGRVVPLVPLAELLCLDAPPREDDDGRLAVLVVRAGGDPVGLIVDAFAGTRDIILKPLEGVLSGLTGFSGTALMGDGTVLMVLDPRSLVR